MRALPTSIVTIIPRRRGAVLLLGAALIGGCNDTTQEFIGTANAVSFIAGADLEAPVASLAGPFVVKVVDTAGTGVPGITVTFSITGPATLVTTTAQTDAGGSAFTSIMFGHTVGAITITATAAGIATPAVVHATSLAGPAAKFVIVGGQGQVAPHGTPMVEDLTVAITDQYDNPVRNVLVTWQAPSGVIGTPSARTAANGRVGTTYTASTVGQQSVQASTSLSDGSTPTLTFTLTGT